MTDLAAIRERVEGLRRHACEPCEPDPNGWMIDRDDVLALLADTPSVEPAGLRERVRTLERANGEMALLWAETNDRLDTLAAAAKSVLACGVGNLSPPKYQRRVEAFDALDDAVDAALLPTQASDSPEPKGDDVTAPNRDDLRDFDKVLADAEMTRRIGRGDKHENLSRVIALTRAREALLAVIHEAESRASDSPEKT